VFSVGFTLGFAEFREPSESDHVAPIRRSLQPLGSLGSPLSVEKKVQVIRGVSIAEGVPQAVEPLRLVATFGLAQEVGEREVRLDLSGGHTPAENLLCFAVAAARAQ